MASIAYGIFVIQFLLSQFIDFDGDCDGDLDASSIVSFKGLVHFAMGLSGWLAYKTYLNVQISAMDWVYGILIGLLFMVILYFVYRLCLKLQHQPKLLTGEELVGKYGVVHFCDASDKAWVIVYAGGESQTVLCRHDGTVQSGDKVKLLSYNQGIYSI